MHTNSYIIYIKTEDKDIADDDKNRYDTSNCEVDRPLPKGMNKQVIGLMKDQLRRKIIKKFVALRSKTYSYLKMMIRMLKNLKKQKNRNKKNAYI